MKLREQIRRKLCELVFDDGEPKKKINKTVDEILTLIEKGLPKKLESGLSGLEYCHGWNDYRSEVEQVIKGVE